MVIESVAE